jgi:hypothetical protein
MPSIARFIRNTPAGALRSYFEAVGLALPQPVDWNSAEAEVVTPLLHAVDAMSEVDRARVLLDADRITAMADEVGQTAIFGVVSDRAIIEARCNGHDRALWLFLNDRIAFQRAEEARYSDERRQGRMWDGFVIPPRLRIDDTPGSITALKAVVGKQFGSPNVEIDVFHRTRPTFDDGDSDLVQVTIYRDGAADDFLEFENGALVRRPRRPVYEAALTYEPATGVVEVVAPDRESRAEIARIFARELLSAEFKGEKIKLRRYQLSVLSRAFHFPTDPDDGIESVQVKLLRLMPIDSPGERYTLECLRKATQNVWDAAAARFGGSNPLDGGYLITQVRLTIRFNFAPAGGGGRTLPLTITMPNGCDLKGKTDRERLVGEKYLRRWGFLCDV